MNAIVIGMILGDEKPRRSAVLNHPSLGNSPLADLEPRILLVDDVDTTLAAYDATVLVSNFRRFKRISDFHGLSLIDS